MAKAKGRARGNGQGTVSFDKARGDWVVKVLMGYTAEGNPKHAKRRAKTKTEAEEKLRELHQELRTGKLATKTRLNVGDYLESWLSTLPGDLSPNTRRSYAGTVRNHVKPRIGKRPLGSLSHGEIEAMYRQIEADGLSRTPAYVHRVLAIAFKEACRMGVLAKNPMDLVRSPRPPRDREERFHTREETARLLAFVRDWDDDAAKALVSLGIATGARLSELAGIAWEDVDFEQGCVAIRRQLGRSPGGEWERRPLKTSKSQRVKYLLEAEVRILQAERARQAVNGFPNPLGLALLNVEGRPWEHSHANARLRAACAAAGVRPFSSHVVFRHTYATHLLKSGESLHDVSRELGHSTPSLTGGLYGHHELSSAKRAARARMEYLEDRSEP